MILLRLLEKWNKTRKKQSSSNSFTSAPQRNVQGLRDCAPPGLEVDHLYYTFAISIKICINRNFDGLKANGNNILIWFAQTVNSTAITWNIGQNSHTEIPNRKYVYRWHHRRLDQDGRWGEDGKNWLGKESPRPGGGHFLTVHQFQASYQVWTACVVTCTQQSGKFLKHDFPFHSQISDFS